MASAEQEQCVSCCCRGSGMHSVEQVPDMHSVEAGNGMRAVEAGNGMCFTEQVECVLWIFYIFFFIELGDCVL